MIRRTAKAAVPSVSTEIWAHLIEPETGDLPPAVARYLLGLEFRKEDHRRMAKLSAKASKGTLTDDEREELAEYVRVGHQLAMMQSKARQSLRRHAKVD
jgi:hypothetical protein